MQPANNNQIQLAISDAPARDAEVVIRATIGAAIEVHRTVGPGFLESVYENALCLELTRRGVKHSRQREVKVEYGGEVVGIHRLDLFVEDAAIVELKTVRSFEARHFSVLRSYLRAARLEHGLLLNFAGVTLEVKRVYPKAA